MTVKKILLLGIVLILAGYVLFAPSPFERAFDDNLARAPFAASIARRDAHLRDVFLRRTEQAFNEGGWRAASGALQISLVTEVEIYADDAHINALSRADLMVLLKLESNPEACKAYMFSGADDPTAAPEIAKFKLVHQAAVENGFDRRASGVIWPKPSVDEISNVEQQLALGPVARLTPAELSAEAKYIDGEAGLVCSGFIKKMRNLLAMADDNAADAKRILMANTGRIDVADVLKRLCRDEKHGGGCS